MDEMYLEEEDYPLEGSSEDTEPCSHLDQVQRMDGHQTDGLSKMLATLMECLEVRWKSATPTASWPMVPVCRSTES